MKHAQITFTPVKGVPLKFDVKSVVWHYEEGGIQFPTEPVRMETSYKLRMRFSRKFRKALRHAARNTTPMSLRRIKK